MTWEKTPWFIGGGAEHSAELARLILFAGTSGAEGVVTSDSCKVRALGTPGGGVRITTGAALILNRSAGGSQQSYAGRNPAEHTVTIAPTGGTSRSDLVIARIEDPQYSPWTAPADMTTGTFIRTHVIQNVSSGTTTAAALNLGYSAIALARIDIPANTSTITDAMIKDLRVQPQTRRHREVRSVLPTASVALTDTYDNTFHAGTIPVPAWATQAHLRGDVGGAVITGSTGDSVWRANLGGILTQETAITATANTRTSTVTAGTISIPAHLRGGTSSLTLQGRRRAGLGNWAVDTYSVGVLDVEFVEVPV